MEAKQTDGKFQHKQQKTQYFIADDGSFSKLQPRRALSEERTSGLDTDLHFRHPTKQDPGG